MPALSLPFRPEVLTVFLQPTMERSPTTPAVSEETAKVRSFGDELNSPVNYRRKGTRPVSCYALFK